MRSSFLTNNNTLAIFSSLNMMRRLIKSPSSPPIDDEAREHLLSKNDDHDDEEEKAEEEDLAKEWTLHIRCATTEQKELEINISSEATINQLLECIVRRLNINEESQTVRLIYQGKLLSSLGHVISSEVKNHSFVHVAISPKVRTRANNTPTSQTPRAASHEQVWRGLDVLRERNNPFGNTLSADEVLILRSLFADSIRDYGRQQRLSRNVAEGESDEDFQYRVEREWMEAQSPYSEFRLNIASSSSSSSSSRHSAELLSRILNRNAFAPFFLAATSSRGNNSVQANDESNEDEEEETKNSEETNERRGSGSGGGWRRWNIFANVSSSDGTDSSDLGTLTDLLYGVAVGYTIGFLVIFCIWERNVPYRQKVGLLLGILLQLTMNIAWATVRASSPSSSTTGDNPSGSMDLYNNNSNVSGDGSSDGSAVSAAGAVSVHHIIGAVSNSNNSLRGSASDGAIHRHPILSGSPFGFSI